MQSARPRTAVSNSLSSSGSRQIFTTPCNSTKTAARARSATNVRRLDASRYLLNFERASRVSTSWSNSLDATSVAFWRTQLRQANGFPRGDRTALISTLVSTTIRSTLIGDEPLEFCFGQAALTGFALDFGYGLLQARLCVATNAVLLVQPIEFLGRQHHRGRLAILQKRQRLLASGLNTRGSRRG